MDQHTLSDAGGQHKRVLWGGRWFFLWVALLLWGMWASPGRAQTNPSLSLLTVELWPDYDRPEVLVLLTGELPAGTALPATVTIPIPAGAQVNAVARISSDNIMVDDIEYSIDGDQVTLTTPDSRFRIEFYEPYESEGQTRRFSYTWQADIDVASLEVRVQQPVAATNLTINPNTTNVSVGQDNLTYYNLDPVAVPAGQSFTVEVQYTATSDQLTVTTLVPAGSNSTAGDTSAAVDPGTTTPNWALWLAIGGGLLVMAAVVWQVVSSRSRAGRPRKPRPVRSAPPTQAAPPPTPPAGAGVARFCHHCGQPVTPGDRFCRNCGTPLKGH